MRYYDIACFDVDRDLRKRLGFTRIYCHGVDVTIQPTPKHTGLPSIIRSSKQDILIRALKDPDVAAVAFEGSSFDKKVMERAAEASKPIILPVSHLLWCGTADRRREILATRKALSAAHRLRTRIMIATLAENPESLLSSIQLEEIANMVSGQGEGRRLIEGGGFDI